MRNLSLTTTEQVLRDIFNRISDNDVQKLKMMRDFAFIHFASREKAEKAMRTMNRKTSFSLCISCVISCSFPYKDTEINGTKVEITWAKPVKDKKIVKSKTPSRKSSSVSMPPASPRADYKPTMTFPPNLNNGLISPPTLPGPQSFQFPQTSLPPMLQNHLPTQLPE